MKQLCHQFKQRLGESETLRIALESEKLRLSLQNITQSPRTHNVAPPVTNFISSTPAHVTSPQHHVTSSQHHLTSPQRHMTSPYQEEEHVTPHKVPVPDLPNVSSNADNKVHMGVNLTNACNDITEVREKQF